MLLHQAEFQKLYKNELTLTRRGTYSALKRLRQEDGEVEAILTGNIKRPHFNFKEKYVVFRKVDKS